MFPFDDVIMQQQQQQHKKKNNNGKITSAASFATAIITVDNISVLPKMSGVGGNIFLVDTIGKEEIPPRSQLWMEQYLTSVLYNYTIWADPNWIWGLAILTDCLFSVNNILKSLWLNYILSVEITLFLLADILLQHMALFQC